jgi:hypothetical protein
MFSCQYSDEGCALYGKGKAIPVTGRGGPCGWETSRLSHFLDKRFTDGGEVVSLTCRPPFTPRKIPGTHICRLSRPQGHSAAGRIRLIEKSNDMENRTRVLPAYSTVPHPTTLPRAPCALYDMPKIVFEVSVNVTDYYWSMSLVSHDRL